MKNWSEQAWQNVSPLFDKIKTMDFIQELAKGTLDKASFLFYLFQDSEYLNEYGKILSAISAKLESIEDRTAFLQFSSTTIYVEQELHKTYFKELEFAKNQFEVSPSCLLYTSYLHKLVATAPIEVALAGVLPCFRVYKEVGDFILSLPKVANNPYQKWIDTYGGEDFALAVQKAESITNNFAVVASEKIKVQMQEAYTYATRLEYLFWDSAYQQEKWKI